MLHSRDTARALATVAALLLSLPALAGGGPHVDFSALPEAASVRPVNTDGSPHQAVARLLTDVSAATPGGKMRLGLYLEPDEGWHSYWKSPGDIGLPTDIHWQLPDGTTASPYQYPVPLRFEEQGVVSYGYDGGVLLFTELTLPDPLPAEATLGLEASWLVCKSTCVPGSAAVQVPLPVAEDRADLAPSPWAPLFDAHAARHPTALAALPLLASEVALSPAVIPPNSPFTAVFTLHATDGSALGGLPPQGSWPTFTPITSYDWMVNSLRVCPTEAGGVMAVIEGESFEPDPLPSDAVIGGLFQVKHGEDWLHTELLTPMPWVAAAPKDAEATSPLIALAASCGVQTEAAPAAGDAPPKDATLVALEEMTGTSGASLFALMLGAAFLGGIILNAMPCVLPVLTLKLYGLVSHAESDPAHNKRAGLAYTLGILVSFWALAGAVILAQTVFGMSVGWGFQFQSPLYVASLATIVFTFALSLFGTFEIPALGMDKASEATQKEGVLGDFFYGVFATLLSTPCSAPFLGFAVGFAFSQPPAAVMLFFTVIGLGLAAPYLAVAFIPALFRFMPRPGAWMETFKQLMGFTLLATALWMVDVLGSLLGASGMTGFLFFLATVALGSWIFGHFGGLAASGRRQLAALGAAIAVAVLGGWAFLDLEIPDEPACANAGEVSTELSFEDEIPWQPFSPERVEALAGHTVFIDFTADWCLTCKVNERTVLETRQVREAMEANGVIPLKADWTRRDDVIGAWLARYGRAGVPFYLVVPADRSRPTIPLSEVITWDMVVSAMEDGASAQ
ncbi:MAG: thioredoxin family protein [Deltaproteobacteria bacterium]|nr:thioredoxin family protein [Deltaproteobacteria bacterium]